MAEHACITRRSFLGDVSLAGGLAALPASLPASAAAHPDAELIRLDADLTEAWRFEDAVRHEFAGRSTHETDACVEKAIEAGLAVVARIRAVRAATLDGLRVKARAVSWCYGGDPVSFDEDHSVTSEHLMAGIVTDLLRMRIG